MKPMTFAAAVLLAGAVVCTVACTVAGPPVARADDDQPPRPLPGEPLADAGLADLSLEQLGDVRVTSVSRRPQSLTDAAASVYVITAEDIRRSGARTLPEALRLAPTLEVARADANQYAISARGFASVLANKMLVLIDGRTVYSPLFSGTFWEAQDVLLDDIDRIEVISGPGGTMWGTNAVNGVVNVIRKPAAESQGALVTAGGGDELRVGQARYGGARGAHFAWRAWARGTVQDHTERADESHVVDASRRLFGGFQADWGPADNLVTLQGGASNARIEQVPDRRYLSAYHLLGRWTRETSPTASLRAQVYWDRTHRDQSAAVHDALDTYDLEFQHTFRPLAGHDLLWGGGFRYQWDQLANLNPAAFAILPDHRALHTGDAFVEDAVQLARPLRLIAGVKAERNEYTHLEWLPSLKLAWKPAGEHLVWGAVSRAVRAPARVDREFFSPGTPPYVIAGGPAFLSEVSNVVELGWRGQATRSVSGSLTGFYHHHDRLRSLEPTPDGLQFRNGIDGKSWGAEAWAKWAVTPRFRLTGGAVDQRRDTWLDAGVTDINGEVTLGNDPRYWWSLGSAFDVGTRFESDLTLRQVGPLPNPPVPRYTTVDARLGYEIVPGLDLSVSGRNLLQPTHAEWGSPAARAVFERTWFVQLRWR